MTPGLAAMASAFWFGILTSISPCPLATNIAAISFVARHVGNPRKALVAGLLYTGGRMLAYAGVGALLVSSLLAAPALSNALQKHMNLALGPFLILVGMALLEMLSFGGGGGGTRARMQPRIEALGVWGAGVLGLVFALSFCPTSAVLFFGSLLPLAVQRQSGLVLPAVYGLATGLPVLFFAVLIARCAHRVATAYNRIRAFEKWARLATGALLVAVGIYLCLTTIFNVQWFPEKP